MDWQLIIGVLAGLGTALGTIAAFEAYFSKKFLKAVKDSLTSLEIDRKIRHLERDYATMSKEMAEELGNLDALKACLDGLTVDYQELVTRTQHCETEIERAKQADIRAWNHLNAFRIKLTKCEASLRAITRGASDEVVSAIFDTETDMHEAQ